MFYSQPPVYLVDFSVYKPSEDFRVDTAASCAKALETDAAWTEENLAFGNKIMERSGIGSTDTYVPAWIDPAKSKEMKNDMASALVEAELTMCGAVSELLEKTGVSPQQIDILVTNCSIFCPTPSLASMLVNHFKFRPDVQSYNLGGMGCANGVMAVGLLKELLVARPGALALFVPSEIVTYATYKGTKKEFMVANAIFRMGGAAVLMASRHAAAKAAKYKLLHNVRVHTGQDDAAYKCMGFGPDEEMRNGVWLDKDVPKHAANALGMCLHTLAPRIMTWAQYAEAAQHLVQAQVRNPGQRLADSMEGFHLEFSRCVDHFALHSGGYAVLKGLQKAMNLPAEKALPSFATLKCYGNTSCSTTWYTMGYLESIPGGIRRGERVMQVGLGGGMKAGVNVWQAVRDIRYVHPAWSHVAERPLTDKDLPRPIADPTCRVAGKGLIECQIEVALENNEESG